jgi:hypothetical protein
MLRSSAIGANIMKLAGRMAKGQYQKDKMNKRKG